MSFKTTLLILYPSCPFFEFLCLHRWVSNYFITKIDATRASISKNSDNGIFPSQPHHPSPLHIINFFSLQTANKVAFLILSFKTIYFYLDAPTSCTISVFLHILLRHLFSFFNSSLCSGITPIDFKFAAVCLS